jgi:hypothetical protein
LGENALSRGGERLRTPFASSSSTTTEKGESYTDEAFTSEALKFACEVGWISRGGGSIS